MSVVAQAGLLGPGPDPSGPGQGLDLVTAGPLNRAGPSSDDLLWARAPQVYLESHKTHHVGFHQIVENLKVVTVFR